ncbi:hypothetical protein J3B02_002042 [Coemansia erecta]|uniref:Tyrosinase copper-binding domain-containing protein n=1 Tax=Coemansia asiatica TaxID=1052880 RepID=A0A9W8CKX1_9FUNG|nr:hypothetical protein LPJ64_001109 [Coemansia asiatica]KAJ2855674.1 hypothetical protein J3B02_002042 [Coemansia erecta]KAJ2888178.1 hypothetical protein FB639_000809 [Coemansia asiatica]
MILSVFLVALLAASSPEIVSAQAPQRCTEIRIRRSAHSLTPSEWQRIHTVVDRLHSQGQFERFASSHQTVFNDVHGKSAFFPFHRRFVLEFENLGRRIDPQFTIPYWDTTRDYRDPASSPVLRNNTLGGNGQGANSCVMDGIQGSWDLGFPTRHCMQRRYSNGNNMKPWISPEVISSYIQSDKRLTTFREHIEFGIHGATHLGLGGDAATKYAPNDFFFHMHHANIDRLWWQWQNNQDAMFDYNGPGPRGEATLDDAIPQDRAVNFGSAPVRSVMVLGFNGVCYSYDSAPSPPARYPGVADTDDDSNGPARAVRGGEPLAPVPMLSGSSLVANRGLEVSRIRKALTKQAGLKDFFPQVAVLEPSRLETIMSASKHAMCGCMGSEQREDLAQHRRIEYPAPMTDDWIKMHGFDPERVQAVHREACRLIDLLNNSTYVSPY